MKDRNGANRAAGCAALIALLAVSGYMGAQPQKQTAAVSVPIVFERMESMDFDLPDDAGRGTLKDREKALMLLDSVIGDPRAAESSVQAALARKAEMAEHIEKEARIVHMLEAMGFAGTEALCSGQMTALIVPKELALDEKTRVQMIDAAANISGQNAGCIKIIPQKNE